MTSNLQAIVQNTKRSAQSVASLPTAGKNHALEVIAQTLEQHIPRILEANRQDVEQAYKDELPAPLINRLKLDEKKVKGMIEGVRTVAQLPDPVGVRQIHRELTPGLILERITVPLGVVGVIFEARPDAVTQIASLAIKSGNGAILKGGKEALNSCTVLVELIQAALRETEVSPHTIELVTTRGEVLELLNLDNDIDLIIPRGSNEFVRFIQSHTKIPVLGHAEGLCHLYIDAEADLDMAVEVTIDSKTQYPAACNAIETLLVHSAIAPDFLSRCLPQLEAKQVEVRGCDRTRSLFPGLKPATAEDWRTEYCALILAVKVVDSLEEAITHINTYGSRHTEAIVTTNSDHARKFQQEVDAAGVYHNCSTRFADGFRYGFGAEVGISTQKLPPRGPVGLEGLVTYRYYLTGKGHTVAATQSFTHRDLPLGSLADQ
ncbi:MAG: glutamate-5-semialdehyde dehydrogenase [Pseudanabaenaceae cyanobacterium SKYGB_i_bin29]|nr:glutamate-5-semialdehyde dehydrogenase [Pseudanabaenaceae cyanobacterium SKYG29]MDW8421685.1 glutamate-5-semialdehyde dehydrogenase [Pseudanabaenaceae cyanobacterium SKYGB_i_bin29]